MSSEQQSLADRLRGLIISHIQTDEIDKFLRVLKQFYINSSKKLYTNLLDWMLGNAVATPADVKVKKEVFKHITEQSDQNIYTCLLLQSLLFTQVMTSLGELDELIREAVTEYQARELEEKMSQSGSEISQKERKLMERRQELFVKNVQGEV